MFLGFQAPNIIHIHFHSFKTIPTVQSIFLFFYHILNITHSSPPKKVARISLLEIWIENHVWWPTEGEGEGSHAWWPMEGEGEGSHAWRPMEGERKGFHAWWPIEGERKGSRAWWPIEGEREVPFHLFSFSPQQILLKPSFFPLILSFYFTMVLGCYLCISSLFFEL